MFKRVPGTRDILPQEASLWQKIEETCRKIFSLYNYQEIRPPLIEEAQLFDRSLGKTSEIIQKHQEAVELINASGRPVLSLDIPSGVNGETGEVMGTAVRADHTLAFGLPKIGNMLHPGCGLCGRLHVCHISVPPTLYDDDAIMVETNGFIPLPPREPTAHKVFAS